MSPRLERRGPGSTVHHDSDHGSCHASSSGHGSQASPDRAPAVPGEAPELLQHGQQPEGSLENQWLSKPINATQQIDMRNRPAAAPPGPTGRLCSETSLSLDPGAATSSSRHVPRLVNLPAPPLLPCGRGGLRCSVSARIQARSLLPSLALLQQQLRRSVVAVGRAAAAAGAARPRRRLSSRRAARP